MFEECKFNFHANLLAKLPACQLDVATTPERVDPTGVFN